MITCIKCNTPKDEKEFSFADKAKKYRKRICKSCTVLNSRVHNKANYSRRKEVIIDHSARYKKEVQDYIIEYLQVHPCVDCKEADIVVLDFDHRDPKEKSMAVSTMVTKRFSLEKIQEEIAKCDVRCANCHRRRTAKQRGWYKLYQ